MSQQITTNQAIPDNGLGLFATCDCEDAAFHHRVMTHDQIQARWVASQTILVTCFNTNEPVRVYRVHNITNGHVRQVMISVGNGDAGPHWYCKHILRVLAAVLYDTRIIKVVNFGTPDTIPLPMFDTISVDGWLEAIYFLGKENER